MNRRRLTDDEHALWQGVARSVSPLRKRASRQPAAGEPDTAGAEPKSRIDTAAKPQTKPQAKPHVRPLAKSPAKSIAKAIEKPADPAPSASLGRKLKRRVKRGSQAIDGRLDLHGMTQAEAHGALLHFLSTRRAHGADVVLVITGKGARGDSGAGERGVLKRMVPIWLGQADFRGHVTGFETASIRHGGEGALYVRLRRVRDQ